MSKHFLLLYGLGHGAWTWFKIVALLQKDGHRATAIDNPAQGKDVTDPESITTLAQLSSNAIRFLESLPESERVILVAHCYGGLVANYILEHLPHKVSAAVYVSGYMFPSQDMKSVAKFLDVDAVESGALDLTYAKDATNFEPLSISLIPRAGWLYQLSPPETVALPTSLLKPGACLPVEEVAIKLSPERYGSVPRVFIRLVQDRAVVPQVADALISSNPPSEVLSIDTDHSPFFSAPIELHQHLIHFAQAYTYLCPAVSVELSPFLAVWHRPRETLFLSGKLFVLSTGVSS